MKDAYKDWRADPRDVAFDRRWHLLQVIASLVAATGTFFYIFHTFFS